MLQLRVIYVKKEVEIMRNIQLLVKRIFDLIIGIAFILILTIIPVLVIIPIVIKITSKGPAIFKQERMGKNGKTFYIYKFRTMLIPEERITEDGRQLEPRESITKIGKFLRKTSLDELPQLFNVVNGTMSIVGPRPTLPYQVNNYTEEQKHRHDMRPGVTGLAQVNGRNELTWTEKIEFDLYYVNNYNLLLDIKILFKTVAVVFKREGIDFQKEDTVINKKG